MILLEPYAALVSDVDKQLNENSGIRLPEIQLRIGIHSGWNPRQAEHGAPSQTAPFAGFSAFDESITQFSEQHIGKIEIERVTDDLISARYLLTEDRELVVDNALKRLSLGLDIVRSKGPKSQP